MPKKFVKNKTFLAVVGVFLAIALMNIHAIHTLQNFVVHLADMPECGIPDHLPTEVNWLTGLAFLELTAGFIGLFFLYYLKHQKDPMELWLEQTLPTTESAAEKEEKSEKCLDDSSNLESLKNDLATCFAGASEQSDEKFYAHLLTLIAPELEIIQGLVFKSMKTKGDATLKVIGGYAVSASKREREFAFGEGLVGQVAQNQRPIFLGQIPAEHLMETATGLGNSAPTHLCLLPIVHKQETLAVFELATFRAFSEEDISFLTWMATQLGEALGTPSQTNVKKHH